MTEQQTPQLRPLSDAERRLYEVTGNGAVPGEPPPPAAPVFRGPSIAAAMKKSGLRQHFMVEMDDGTVHDVNTTIQDSIRYEKTHAKRGAEADAMPITRMLYLAWAAIKRVDPSVVGTFPEFEAHIAEFHVEDDEDDVDPTRTAPGDE